ncbi:MAG: Asp-tRNA(Asn)/Glu-tRNA(Gln) amidotransferase subunit GatA [Patescibacteria group bacterium]
MELHRLSLLAIRDLIHSGQITSSEVFAHFKDRAAKLNPGLNAFVTLAESAPAVDPQSPLAGIPIGVKDVFSQVGIRNSAGSKMLEDFAPPYNATVIERLKTAGFTSLGTCNMDEYAMGSSGENSAFGATANPWSPDRIPGGSSSGSAAAVAAGLAPASLGTDTGGSIRFPASMCGIVGFKPTYGRNSRFGVIAMASSLDCPGTFTKTVRDAAYLYEITAGQDAKDSTSRTESTAIDPAIWDKKDLKGVRVGVPKEYFREGLDTGVRTQIENAIKKLEELGAEIKEVTLPSSEYGLAVYYIIMAAEASTNLSRYDGVRFGHIEGDGADIAKNRAAGFGPEPTRRIMLGSFVLSSGFYDAYYKKASLVRELIRNDFKAAFESVDVIVGPVGPTVAWKIGEKVEDPLKMYLADIYTVPPSLAGLPGLSVPVGFAKPEDGSGDETEMPVGLHILGAQLDEEKVFMVGHVLEQALASTISTKSPKIF